VKGSNRYEGKKICTLKKSSYAAYKIIFSGLTYYYINVKGSNGYEGKKICTFKKSSYAAYKNI
jgi:hypothetical protein